MLKNINYQKHYIQIINYKKSTIKTSQNLTLIHTKAQEQTQMREQMNYYIKYQYEININANIVINVTYTVPGGGHTRVVMIDA